MTRLQIALGLIEASYASGNNAELHIKRCEKEIAQLDSMIDNVLTLSKMENTFLQANLSSVNIRHFINGVIEDAQYLANNKSIQINTKISHDVEVTLDKNLMQGALNNVFLNAIKYSQPHSEITFELKRYECQLQLSISDTATGVPDDQLALLFKPFYRVSTARDRDSGGTG